MNDWEKLTEAVIAGRHEEVRSTVDSLLTQGYSANRILQEALMPAMQEVGRRFDAQEIFIPEMMIAARAFKFGSEVLRTRLPQEPAGTYGKVLIGTVQGDLHDIGKNLVAMAMRCAGFTVIDLGVDVSPAAFLSAAEKDADVRFVGISALLTTTMSAMEETVRLLRASPAAGRLTILVGGAPVTERFARKIGADIYTSTAFEAANAARAIAGSAPAAL